MKTLMILAVLVVYGMFMVQGSLLEFQDMIKKVTGRNAVPDYSTYGCHCGWGGRGTPKDATDRCCATHDCCYKRAEKRGCRIKTDRYRYSYSSGTVTCGGGTSCERMLCACDKAAAYCMRSNLRSYNDRLKYFPNWQCSGRDPSC
ncbi:phospholipase A2, membrane associated-like [Tachyglossus aculeatus]|uniref:phospholipase A2, membrane associated-like n=1 Tax=Tachyglossus aculeatus TaxID=9261 RepID=UPI0018F3C97E|nr:phospholipase A2, membrane associated-like [Tachyglossus aculeatus]XP_038602949.1 phospholipase A2, membrane associated-like [Tachyglossus aculeatus]